MNCYVTLLHEVFDLEKLPTGHKRILQKVSKYFAQKPPSHKFNDFWQHNVLKVCGEKVSKEAITETPLYKICQDMESRLGIEEGYIRQPDYRDVLSKIIYENFSSRYQFCKVTGVDEAFLSNVLSKKKSFSIENLIKILDKIGYELEIKKKSA